MANLRRRLAVDDCMLGPLVWPLSAAAQDRPCTPIGLVISFAPGSSHGVLGRAVDTPLSQALGVPVVVENRSGAGGLIGAELVTKAAGDGYTLLMASGSTMVVVPTLTPKMPYDHNKALVPVAATARLELFLVFRALLLYTSDAANQL